MMDSGLRTPACGLQESTQRSTEPHSNLGAASVAASTPTEAPSEPRAGSVATQAATEAPSEPRMGLGGGRDCHRGSVRGLDPRPPPTEVPRGSDRRHTSDRGSIEAS